MTIKVGSKVEMTSYPDINGTVTWVEPEVLTDGDRIVHLNCNGHTYRLGVSSLTVLKE